MRLPLSAVFALSPLLWLLLVGGFARAQNPPDAPDFSVYRQAQGEGGFAAISSDAFAARSLTETDATRLLASKALLTIRRLTSPGLVFACTVHTDGMETDGCSSLDGERSRRQRRFNPDELLNLRFAIFDLPAAGVTPPIERLVVVGFRDDERWIIRSYDAAALPDAVRRIQGIIAQDPQAMKDFDPKMPFNAKL